MKEGVWQEAELVDQQYQQVTHAYYSPSIVLY